MIDTFFEGAQKIVIVMSSDILSTSMLELEDLLHIFKGLVNRKNLNRLKIIHYNKILSLNLLANYNSYTSCTTQN